MINELAEKCSEINVEVTEIPNEKGNPDYPSFVTGARGVIDESRAVEMIILSDKSVSIKFTNSGDETRIRLSEDAMQMTLSLWIRLLNPENTNTDLPLSI